MFLFAILLSATLPFTILCAPYKDTNNLADNNLQRRGIQTIDVSQIFNALDAKTVTKTVTVTAACTAATAATTTAAAAGEEVEEEKTRSNGTLGTAFALKGANELQAVSFAGSTGVGAIEIEYQNLDGRTLTVVENKTPSTAPAGFKFADTSSYQVTLAEGAANITRQQIDYTFNLANTAVKAANISAVRTGKLCTDTNTFIIDAALGTQDFEDDEGESTFLVKSIIGEWALFLPN